MEKLEHYLVELSLLVWEKYFQLEHFLDVMSGGATPVVSARDGMVTLAATLAVDIAAREDRTVTVASLLP